MKYKIKICDIEYTYEAETVEQIKHLVETLDRDSKPITINNVYNKE